MRSLLRFYEKFQEILNLKFRNNVFFTSESFFVFIGLSLLCSVVLWINGLKSMGIIGDKIFDKEILPSQDAAPRDSISGMSSLILFLFVYGDIHRNRS